MIVDQILRKLRIVAGKPEAILRAFQARRISTDGREDTSFAPATRYIWLPGALSAACNSVFFQGDRLERLTPAAAGVRYEDIMLPSTNGVMLHAWHIQPQPGTSTGQHETVCRGTIVQFHGNAENMTTHVAFVAWLAKSGFDVVTFDYRGYGRSTGISDRAGVVDDGAAILSWTQSATGLAGKPVAVLGQSLGGAVALAALERAKDVPVKAIVLDSTFDSYRQMARDKLASVWFLWPIHWPLSFLVTDELSPRAFAASVRIPVLAMHGRADPVVPWERGRALFDALNSPDREFWEIDRAGHIAALADEDSPYRARLLNWLCQHLR